MPNMPDSYYDNFNASKNYEKILYRDGYTLQGAELNEAQSAAMHRLQGVADALFKDGDIIRDAGIIVNKETGEVRAQSGAVYLRGAVRGVPEATFTIPVVGTVAVGIRLTQRVVSELEDPALYNPAIGSRGEGEPGAWRLQVNAAWGFDGDNGDGEFYVVYTVDDGELRAKEAPPTLDTFTQSIARYDRDSTAGGSYIVDGLTVLMAGDDADGHQVDVVEMLDGVTLRSYTVTLGQTNTLTIGSEAWLKVVNGSHTLKIVATDAKDASVTRTLTFTKAVTSVEFEQTLAMEADAMPTKALVNIQGNFPAGCTLQVWICNNGNDASPTWEDITQKARTGQKHYFTNQTKTAAAWGVKVKAKLLRGSATETCYIQSIGGNFA